MCTGIQPSITSSQNIDFQSFLNKKQFIYIRDLQFSTRRRFYPERLFNHIGRIEIQARYRHIGFGIFRLLLNIRNIALFIENRHAVSLRVIHIITENHGFILFLYNFYGLFQLLDQPCAVEQIVPQNQTNRVIFHKIFPYMKCLGKPFRFWLFGISEFYTKSFTVTQKALERRQIFRGGN